MTTKKREVQAIDGEILPPTRREVGLRIGQTVYSPVLSADSDLVNAQNGYLRSHNLAVSLLDQYHVLREQYAAHRSVIWRPAADFAAQQEEDAEMKHHQALGKLRREKEIHEQTLAALEAKHKLEATEEFKPIKFATGAARFAEKTAKFRVGEAVANASMRGQDHADGTGEDPAPRPLIVDALLQGIDDLEKQIEEREASGLSAETLHAQRDALRELVLRELKKGR